MSGLATLKRLINVPTNPLEVPTLDDWRDYERDLTVLPSDYKEFISLYGTGLVDQFLAVYNPASRNDYLNLLWQREAALSVLSEKVLRSPDMYPMTCFPEPEGFLPFAGTDNGDTLYWVTRGKPADWTVAVMGPRNPKVFRYEGGMVDFLIAILRREVHCSVFPSGFPDPPPVSFTFPWE